MPLMPSALISSPMSQSSWRLIQTKVLSSSASLASSAAGVISSSGASLRSLAATSGSSLSTSSGIAQMLAAGTLEARIRPLRSRMRPRLAGSSSVRAKRTSPWRWKKSLPNTCTYAARAPRPTKPSASMATIILLRHSGVLLASKGLEV
ncbi:hypothetical protein D3C85_1404530 [compost metagenome]